MNYGIQKCIWTALGDVSANIVQATLVIFVLGSFFVDNPNFLNIFKWIGIAYLFYLAYDVYKIQPKDPTTKNIITKSFFSFFKDGFLVAGTSPKAWAFFPLIFPQFIDFNSNYIFQFFILITTYVVLDFASLMGYALIAEKIVKWLKTNPRTINTISACVLVVIAFAIALTQNY
jgi:threonine/homoserine/homoserine lactone efflux protein|tara:strand:- start:101 stop:622 length:522 start_codon:yes stop_codon:yes gene_type:complete